MGTTPIFHRVLSFGQTRGLAFGQYGEASPDVHALLTNDVIAAGRMVEQLWHKLGARRAKEARSFIVASLRRRLVF